MKTCIWCRKKEDNVSFVKKAHTIPQSLGGENICENVCDDCNHYFGAAQPNTPSVEVVFKEILNISKYFLLKTTNTNLKNKRYKSEYFNINWETFVMKMKPRYKLKIGFQEKLGRQFRRALYKVFLEERERQKGDALDSRFDFIREFARYNLGNFPAYIQIPKFKAIFTSIEDVKNPQIRFTDSSDRNDEEFRIYTYMLMGHTFCIPTSAIFEKVCLENFKRHLVKTDHPFGTHIKYIQYAEDIDYTFNFVKD